MLLDLSAVTEQWLRSPLAAPQGRACLCPALLLPASLPPSPSALCQSCSLPSCRAQGRILPVLGLSALEERLPPSPCRLLGPATSLIHPQCPVWCGHTNQLRVQWEVLALSSSELFSLSVQGQGCSDRRMLLGGVEAACCTPGIWPPRSCRVCQKHFTHLCLGFPIIKKRHKCFPSWEGLSNFGIAVFWFPQGAPSKGIKSLFFSLKSGTG